MQAICAALFRWGGGVLAHAACGFYRNQKELRGFVVCASIDCQSEVVARNIGSNRPSVADRIRRFHTRGAPLEAPDTLQSLL